MYSDMPERKTGIIRRTVPMSSGSDVNMDATTDGKEIIDTITAALKENMVTRDILKHAFTLPMSPCP